MKNILVVVGSGNRNGNTDTLVESFIKGATESGHHVKKVNLNGHIQGCRAVSYTHLDVYKRQLMHYNWKEKIWGF